MSSSFATFSAKFGRRRGFEAEVRFELHRARQRVDDLDQSQPAPFRRIALGHARDEIHVAQIARELAFDAGAQHLDGDLARLAVIKCVGDMHLRDRRGRDGLAEREKDILDLASQRFLDDRHGLRAAKGRHAILQRGERVGDLSAHDVGTRREKLPELHVGGADLRERAHQRRAGVLAVRLGEQIGETHERRRRGRQQVGVERGEHALARQNIASAREAQKMTESEKHGERRLAV